MMETTSYISRTAIPGICTIVEDKERKTAFAKTSDFCAGEHVLGAFVGRSSGPTLIVIGGVHGNEPAGVIALAGVLPAVAELQDKLHGRVYFLAGNTRAISKRVRFIDADLNRFWSPHNLSNVGSPELLASSEGVELTEIDRILDGILVTAMDEVFVIDLHSTSAKGLPFATVGDTLRNRAFAKKFPVTLLLGIEEQLDGTMLEYLNNAGAVTLGFEGGQHLSADTVEKHEAIVWLALTNSGILDASDNPNLDRYRRWLADGDNRNRIFEVRYRHALEPDNQFEMTPGFNNFDSVRRGDVLGKDRNGPVTAIESGQLLMPLYQKLGNDGFFIGREISPFWLWLSGLVRGIGLQKIIHILPGVRRDSVDPATLIVNTSVARLFPLQIFHLLGFRRRRWAGNNLVVSRRKHDTSGPFKWQGHQIMVNGR